MTAWCWTILAGDAAIAQGVTEGDWADGDAAAEDILADHIATTGSYPYDWAQLPDGWLAAFAAVMR